MMTTNEQRPRRNLIGWLTLNASRSLRRRAEQFRLSALDAGAPPIQVFIATTLGTVGVQGLSIEPGAALSVMCIGGRPRETRVSRAYHGFVAQGTGIVEKRYGAGPYRMDVSGEIDTGSSWQLGAVTAHALYRVGRLVQGIDRLDRQPSWIVWATGAARASDGVVECVEAVADKLQIVLPKLIEVARAGIRVSVVVPVANADDISQQQRADIARHNIEWCTVATVDDLERLLGADRRTRLPVPAGLAALATLTIALSD